MTLPETEQLGPLEPVEVYAFYDGPRLLAYRDERGQFVLAAWLRTEGEGERWYAAPLSRAELRNLRHGVTDLRSAFERPAAGYIWLVEGPPSGKGVASRLNLDEVDRDLLPSRGDVLDLPKNFEYGEDDEEVEGRVPDLEQASARETIRRFFTEHSEAVFTTRQLEVFFEGRFFHWVTNRAVHDLLEEQAIVGEEVGLDFGGKAKLIWKRGYRYYRRSAKRLLELVQRYSSRAVAGTLGDQGELLTLEGFARSGFLLKDRGKRREGPRGLIESMHNVDFVFERDGVGYGVEVKNTLGYMDYAELKTKLALCGEIGVRPVFVVRMMPKTWMYEVNRAGGFVLILKYQLYPPAHEELAETVRKELGLPVGAPRRLRDETMDRVNRWHERVRM